MTIAFTQYSAGPWVDLVDAGQAVSVALANLGFQAREGIIAVRHDPEDDSFEDGRGLLVAPMELLLASPAAGVLGSETGFRVEFINASVDLTVTVRIVNHGKGAVSLFEIQDRAFYRFVKQAPARSVVRLLAAGAICIQAGMGFGAFETEWESYSEDQILGFIVEGPPGYQGRPPPFGVIETERFLSNEPLASRIGALFDVYREQAYTVLVRKGALALFASL
jgi:hypothetical protein